MPSLTRPYLDGLRFEHRHAQALVDLGRQLGTQTLYTVQQPEVLDTLRQTAIIASTVSSNRLEGIEVDEGRLAELMQPRARPRTRSEQEVAGYKQALELIHDSHEHMPITPNTILQLHRLLYRYHPAEGGRFKSQDNTIVETDPRGSVRVRFEPTSAMATPWAIEQMCTNFRLARQDASREDLVVAPLFVLDFLCIHPFADGNGRVSRLLTLLLLYQLGDDVGRYISLERVIEQSKEGYYAALEASSAGWHEDAHDPMPWLEYFWGMLTAANAEFEERVDAILDASVSKAEQVELVALSFTHPFKLADLKARLPNVSDSTITKALGGLRDRGRARLEGRGRGATWHVVDERGED